MTEEKIHDIIVTMVEYNLIDPVRALTDSDYLAEQVLLYIKSANIAREMLHMPLIS